MCHQNRLTKWITKNVGFRWPDTEEKMLKKLKVNLLSPKVLEQPDFTKPFLLETDAGNTGLGAILLQGIECVAKTITSAKGSRKTIQLQKKKHYMPFV